MSGAPGYQLPKAHRKKLRRMRAVVDAASTGEGDETGAVTADGDVATAIAFLEKDSACEQFMLSGVVVDGSPVPRCASKQPPTRSTRKRTNSRSRRSARRAAEHREKSRKETETFWRETRRALGLKGSSALDKTGIPKGDGREVSGGLPTLGKRP